MTAASVELLLSRLESVRPNGKGWRACCPVCSKTRHSLKLSVSEGDDGRVLMHCFAGCDAAQIVQATGLTLGDLFPERLPTETPDRRRHMRLAQREHQWPAALEVLSQEGRIVRIAATQLARWMPLSEEDDARLALALSRIESAEQVLRGGRDSCR